MATKKQIEVVKKPVKKATVTTDATSTRKKAPVKKPVVPAKVTSDKDTVSSIFEKVRQAFAVNQIEPRTKESMRWFQQNISQMRLTQTQILNDSALIRGQQVRPGRLFQFVYDPKTKEELPYYDKFPLTLIVGPAEGGFYGLNLHYLHPFLRARLFDRLLQYVNNDKFDQTTRFRLTYQMLSAASKLRAFNVCFKHYLMDHVHSRFIMVPPKSWEIAVFLPTERFKKKNKEFVWRDTKKQVRGKL